MNHHIGQVRRSAEGLFSHFNVARPLAMREKNNVSENADSGMAGKLARRR
jgi:hypothetical protein